MSALDELVGERVKELWVGPGEGDLQLVCDEAVLVLRTEGDCCSESWWADAVGVKQLVNATVTAVEEIDMPDPVDDRGRQESDVAYGLRITTDQGACDLIYRNSSNGYYGGWCESSWAPRRELEGYSQITEDWSA